MKKWKRFNTTGQHHQKVEESVANVDKVAGKIARFIIRMQHAFAIYMTRRTERLSVKSLKTLLIMFLIAGGALNVWLILGGLHKKTGAETKIFKTSFPHPASNTDDTLQNRVPSPDQLLSLVQYEHLQWYVHFMDSLKTDVGGQPMYDSIVRNRPGLLDSVRMLLKMYKLK